MLAVSLLTVAGLLSASPARAGDSLMELYRLPSLRQLQISPSGGYLASLIRDQGWYTVRVRRRGDPKPVVVFKRASGIRRIQWIDDERILIHVGLWFNPTYHIASVSTDAERLSVREERVAVQGRLVAVLPDTDGEILWADRQGLESSVLRLPISILITEKSSHIEESRGAVRVAKMEGPVDKWVADRHGTVRAALLIEHSSPSKLWYRDSAEAKWRMLVEAEDPDDMPRPLGIAGNGRDLIVLSRRNRDTLALFELSTETGNLGRILFEQPDADITDVVYDPSGTSVIGAVYERDGVEEFHHFDAFFSRYQRSLAHAFPGRAVSMTSVSRDRRYFTIVAASPRDPGTYYLLDTQTNTATEVGRAMPWLNPTDLARVEALRVKAVDGTELEVFVTRPKPGAGRPPLVVMPHGGPIGIRDSRSFDPLLQYLAAGGLAVLQVNYRGSSGRGSAFLEAGKRQWGKGIEEDLEAAIDAVVKRGWADGNRVCVAGGSYGGYSALMSVIRKPARYRCAVSVNGPTDLPFLYYSNRYLPNTKEGRKYFLDYVGDPERDYEGLIAISPAYHASEIQVPVLLMHASEDHRVDIDHFYRMQTVLESLGRPVESFVLQGGDHVPTGHEWVEIAGRMRAFLIRNLDPGSRVGLSLDPMQ